MRLGVNVLWNKRKHAFSEYASAEVEWKKSLLLNRLTDFRAVNGRGKVKFDVNRYSLPIPSIISQLFPKTVEKQAISALTTTPASLANVEVKRIMAVYACMHSSKDMEYQYHL